MCLIVFEPSTDCQWTDIIIIAGDSMSFIRLQEACLTFFYFADPSGKASASPVSLETKSARTTKTAKPSSTFSGFENLKPSYWKNRGSSTKNGKSQADLANSNLTVSTPVSANLSLRASSNSNSNATSTVGSQKQVQNKTSTSNSTSSVGSQKPVKSKTSNVTSSVGSKEPVKNKTHDELKGSLKLEKGSKGKGKVSESAQSVKSTEKFVQPKHRAGWLMPDEDHAV